jgi:hypothetical protein
VCVLVGGVLTQGGSEGRRLKSQYMVDGLHITTRNRTKKPLIIALCGVGRGLRRRDNGGNVNIIQYKSDLNCHF